jgi:hypothetical protein
MKKIAFLGVAVLFLAASAASAQPYEAGSTASGVRGAIGLGLVGTELTMTIEAGAGVTNPWLLSLIPLAVGGGAAAGGYYMELASVEAGVAMLAVGMTLLVPSILLTLVLASETYEPTGEERSTEGPGEPTGGGTASRMPAIARASRNTPSLLAVRDGALKVGLPSLAVLEGPATTLYPAITPSGYEYQLSLVNWHF